MNTNLAFAAAVEHVAESERNLTFRHRRALRRLARRPALVALIADTYQDEIFPDGYGDLGDGEILKRIVEWLMTPGNLQVVIDLIMSLFVL